MKIKVVTSPGTWALALIAFLSPWATYLSLGAGLTAVTLVIAVMTVYNFGAIIVRNRFQINGMTVWFVAYICLVAASFAWTAAPAQWIASLYWWISSLVVFMFCIRYLRSPSDFRLICYASIAGAIFSGLNLQLGYNELGYENTRFSAFGVNSNFTSYAISGGIFITLITAHIFRFPVLVRIFLPVLLGLAYYFQTILETRGSIIAIAAMAGIFLTKRFLHPVVLYMIAVSMGLLAILSATGSLSSIFAMLKSQSSRNTGDLSGRTLIWAEATKMIAEYPFLGIGPGSFVEISMIGVGAHNFFFIILLETGFVGLFVMMGFFFSVLRRVASDTTRANYAFLLAMFSAYWFPIATSGHWETAPFSWLTMGFMAQLAAVSGNIARKMMR